MGEIRNNMIDVILEKHGISDKNVSDAVKEIAYALSKDKQFIKNIIETNEHETARRIVFNLSPVSTGLLIPSFY
ncbi:hypothetical protein [Staphylococcus chromogenes]|uniref:hypothetical protein n=1 Tax=Staphylococcus chromogenes TaxID=46126 RepID=UPI0021D23225|nr:hypothetical protein [Staphylococcus chromogenes]UXS75021.1 hypothetical protein MUA20_08480 [Staphylococcus chromogenes]